MIVGTAGHIDHGKTTLVRALTGVDTDRLPQEKVRGITIELGYAFLDTPDGLRIGFVDVPGHERLVHTMLSGATGIAHALLLVAADDGVMPQTREHLAVLSLLGLQRGTVVITKCDRAAPGRVQAVQAEVQALLQGTPLADAPVLPVSAQTGEGLAALRERLFAAARETGVHPRRAHGFRLAVDRVFTLDGAGTVVTGTVHAGTVAVGDELQLVPGTRRARVRGLHAQNRAVAQAQAGERCAVAVAGLARDEVARGQWLVAPSIALATDRLDAELTLWHAEARPLCSGTPVHVHLGSAAATGTVAVLDPLVLEPGQRGRVQLVLREPVGAWHGDRVVLRDAAASRTLAGGRVLDPLAPMRHRRTPQRLRELDALALPGLSQRLAALLAVAPQGLDLRRVEAAQGEPLGAALQALQTLDATALRHRDAQGDHLLHGVQAAAAAARALEVLARYHQGHPDELGPDSARLRRLALPRLPDPLWRALIARLQAEGRVHVRGSFVHLPEHGVRLSTAEARLAERVAVPLQAAGFQGVWVRDLARQIDEPEALLRAALARLAQRGELHQVVKDLFFAPAAIARLAAIVRAQAGGHGGAVQAAGFRDATGLGRRRAIQVLEHFDRIGLLRRVGDVHWLRGDCGLFEDAAP
jgi:selenocysteine-specific elongation factor